MPKYANDINNLVDCIHWINHKGWSPATSTNYSLRNPNVHNEIFISKSGVDKQFFDASDLILCNIKGQPLPPNNNIKTSAETAIHTWLYKKKPSINCILHTHSITGTVLSKYVFEKKEKSICFEGYEVQKAFVNVNSHQNCVKIPVLENEQDMSKFVILLKNEFKELPASQCFLMAGHGLYVWGQNLAEAKRHLEACEFLMTCYYNLLLIQ